MRWWNPKLWIAQTLALYCANLAFADISTTPHSLVSKSLKSENSEICVFCHTPNLTGTPPEKSPLWQSSLGTESEFVIYDDIGRLGVGKPSVGSQSMACLSCHDANQARGIGKADHPFGIPYRGASKNRGAESSASPADNSAGDAKENPAIRAKNQLTHEDFRAASQGVVEGRKVWWVSKSETTGLRSRNDLPLYARHDKISDNETPFIECSSCHDPHTNNSKFLRLVNNGSQICLTCHIQ